MSSECTMQEVRTAILHGLYSSSRSGEWITTITELGNNIASATGKSCCATGLLLDTVESMVRGDGVRIKKYRDQRPYFVSPDSPSFHDELMREGFRIVGSAQTRAATSRLGLGN